MTLTLAKIVGVNGVNTLDEQFKNDYFPDIDMYLFFTECQYDTTTGSFKGVRKLHDTLIAERGLGDLPSDKMNYISIDNKSSDRNHTYMTTNRRFYQLTEKQKQYIANMFEANYF